MATTLTALILSCRTFAGDGPMDNLQRNENLANAELGNVINGSNTVFSVQNTPVATGGFLTIRADNAVVTPASTQEAIGEFTLATAPSTSVYATYYYYLFPDAVWQEFIVSAMESLNISTGNPTTDVPNVVEGLLAALKIYAHAFFCNRMASQTGLWYNQRLQERAEDRDNVAQKYEKMAVGLFKLADTRRDAFYTDRHLVPSLQVVQHQPLPITPSH